MNPSLPSGRIPTASSSSSAGGSNGSQPHAHKLREAFRRFSGLTAAAVGSPWAFTAAVAAILVWAILGPHYGYSDTWQLVINTGTTIVTFLMVFLIQNTQNRDARAINLKLNELIESIKSAHNDMIDIEHLSDAEIDVLAARYEGIRQELAERKGNIREDPHSDREQSSEQEKSAAR